MENHAFRNPSNFPLVLGLVPAYNAENFILPTLEHLASQNYPNFRVWVCDDASTDSTFETCLAFAKHHPNFKVTRNEKNLGWLRTSEQMWKIGASESDFCFSNPHDDHPTPEYVSDLAQRLISNSKAVLAIPGMRNLYSDGVVIDSFFSATSGKMELTERLIILANRQVHHWWSAYHGLHRSSAVARILPIETLPFGEPEYSVDLVWVIKMAIQGEFVTSNQILLHKHYRKESVSAQWGKGTKNRLGLWMSILREVNRNKLSKKDKNNFRKALLNLVLKKVKLRLKFI